MNRIPLFLSIVAFLTASAALLVSGVDSRQLLQLQHPTVLPHPDPCGPAPGKKALSGTLPSWTDGLKWHVVADGPDQYNVFTVPQSSVMYFNAVNPPGLGPQPNTWTTLDLSSYVPDGAEAAMFSGVLIITHGTSAETADLEIYARRDATVTDGLNYIAQCICALPGDGQRSTASFVVPLTKARTCQWMWTAPTYPGPGSLPTYQYPTYSAYGCNLRCVAYGSPN